MTWRWRVLGLELVMPPQSLVLVVPNGQGGTVIYLIDGYLGRVIRPLFDVGETITCHKSLMIRALLKRISLSKSSEQGSQTLKK